MSDQKKAICTFQRSLFHHNIFTEELEMDLDLQHKTFTKYLQLLTTSTEAF